MSSRVTPSPNPAPAMSRSARLALAILAAIALAGVAPGEAGAQMTIGLHPRMPFPAHIPRPIRIEVGFTLIDFARISGREESFDLQGYLTTSYVDPALARKPDEPGGERRFATDALWTPNLEFSNAAEQVKIQNEAALVVDDLGRITQRIRFVGKFSWPLDLRRFPFDAQTLAVLIEPFERETKDVQFAVNPERVGRMSSAFLTDWTIKDVSARVESIDYPVQGRTSSRLAAEIRITRQSTFYIWRVLLPLTLLVTTSWVVYRFDPTNLQPLISTTVAILLNVILFNFSIDFALPKVPYLTFIDSYAVTCFFGMLANMFVVTAIHVACTRRGPEAARALQARAIRFIPATFALVLAIEAVIFLA